MLLGSITLLAALGAVLTCIFGSFSGAAVVFGTLGCFLGYWLGLFALAFGFLWVCCATVDISKPQEEDSKFFRWIVKTYIPAVFSILRMDIDIQGKEQLPKEGRFLLVCNHLYILDPVLLLGCFPNAQLAFISKRENADMFIIGKIMHRLMCQMINRENDREALKTILKCIQMIKNDQVSVAVFPEGYTSRDGKLHHFRSGVFKIATKTQVPVVLCTVKNTQTIFHNALRLKKTYVPLHVVGVIQPETYPGRTAVDIAQEAYDKMLEDLGPDFKPEETSEEQHGS